MVKSSISALLSPSRSIFKGQYEHAAVIEIGGGHTIKVVAQRLDIAMYIFRGHCGRYRSRTN
ncbi:MAG: hypothetical protein ACYS3N_04620 [Planctomycetota bacterium]